MEAKLTLAGKWSARVVALDGTIVTVGGPVDDVEYAFSPALQADGIAWLPMTIRNGDVVEQLPPFEEPKTYPFDDDRSVSTAWGEFKIENLGIKPHRFPQERDFYRISSWSRIHTSGRATCCISKQGWSVCGASVSFLGWSCESEIIKTTKQASAN
ncbi:MAG: hypothetical protein GY725_15555 [bacterium]|nr:hypothetical protein [bacterium]